MRRRSRRHVLPGRRRLPHNHAVTVQVHPIRIKRVYEKPEADDGARFLVDRLWPRGVKKEALAIEAWLKDVAPSNDLRHRYHHDLDQWDVFRRQYFNELGTQPDAWRPLVEAARKGTITLLFSSKEPAHNNAAALKEFLELQLAGGTAHKRTKGSGRKS